MEFRNDLEMWHKYAEFAEHLKKIARFQEIHLISQCIYYVFDGAFGEYCKCPKIERKGDFKSENECWKCGFYEIPIKKEG